MSKNSLPAFVDDILENSWEQICYFAYDGFSSHGRGVIAIHPDSDGDSSSIEYVVYDPNNLHSAPEWSELVKSYDPEYEFVLQFADEMNNFRTVRIRTPEDGQHPKRVWFFAALEETMNEPTTLENRPEWFLNALEDLEALRLKKEENDK